MLETFSLLLLGAAVFYAALIGYFAVGFRRVRRAIRPARESRARVSVIVAARDEAAHIRWAARMSCRQRRQNASGMRAANSAGSAL